MVSIGARRQIVSIGARRQIVLAPNSPAPNSPAPNRRRQNGGAKSAAPNRTPPKEHCGSRGVEDPPKGQNRNSVSLPQDLGGSKGIALYAILPILFPHSLTQSQRGWMYGCRRRTDGMRCTCFCLIPRCQSYGLTRAFHGSNDLYIGRLSTTDPSLWARKTVQGDDS